MGVHGQNRRRPILPERRENRIDAGPVLDVTGQHDGGADRFGQRPDALAKGAALMGERHLGPVPVQRRRDPPGDGMIVGDPHDEAFLPTISPSTGAMGTSPAPEPAESRSALFMVH